MKKFLIPILIPLVVYAGALRFFTVIGGVAPFSPNSVAGLTAWYDASAAANMFTDTGCSTPVSSDGDLVRCWKDTKSGYNVTDSTTTHSPKYKTAIQNSLSAILYDNVNMRLVSSVGASSIVSTTAHTVYVVFNTITQTGAANFGDYLSQGIFMVRNSADLYLNTQNTYIWGGAYVGGVAKQTGNSSMSANTFYIAQWRHDSGTMYFSLNGGTETSVATGTVDDISDFYNLGNGYSVNNAPNAYYGEFLFYNTAVGSSDRTAIINYEKTKWGIP